MIFDKPTSFLEAMQHRTVRRLMPTTLTSDELSRLSADIRERATFSARVANAAVVQGIEDVAREIVEGRLGRTEARHVLEGYLRRSGYEAPPGKEGTIEDLGSDQRLELIVDTQVGMSVGYGQWRQGQEQSVLDMWPAQELYRRELRKEPRDWPTRWEEAGGRFYPGRGDYAQGRMVAAKDDPLWEAISRFGTPYPPFDFNSGMDVRDVQRAEAVRLGVVGAGQRVYPQRRDFEEDLQAGVEQMDQAIREALVESMGPGYKLEAGVVMRENEALIEQLHNRILLNALA